MHKVKVETRRKQKERKTRRETSLTRFLFAWQCKAIRARFSCSSLTDVMSLDQKPFSETKKVNYFLFISLFAITIKKKQEIATLKEDDDSFQINNG